MNPADQQTPLVSVVIPTFNQEKTITSALDSVLSQTYKNIETIVVDDGSTDKTIAVVEAIKDLRIRYIQHAKNRGASAARNTGIQKSNGEYIAFLDSDDEWLPTKLEKQMMVFADSSDRNLGCVFSYGYTKDETRNIQYIQKFSEKRFNDKTSTLKYFLEGKGINACSNILIKKTVTEHCGVFDEKLKNLEDPEFLIRAAQHYAFQYVDEPLYIRNIHEGSASVKLSGIPKVQSIDYILKKHIDLYDHHKREKAVLIRNRGTSYMINDCWFEGIKSFLRSIQTDPGNLKNYIIAASGLLGPNIFQKIRNIKIRRSHTMFSGAL